MPRWLLYHPKGKYLFESYERTDYLNAKTREGCLDVTGQEEYEEKFKQEQLSSIPKLEQIVPENEEKNNGSKEKIQS